MSGSPPVSPPITAAMVAATRSLADPRVSPDGRQVAWVESAGGRSDLVLAALDGSGPRVVVTGDTPVGGRDGTFAWAGPDRLVHVAADGRLVVVGADGGPPLALTRDGRAAAPAVSPDGRRVACVIEREDVCDIAVVPLDGSAWPQRISTGAAWAFDPAWSADGQRVAWHEWDADAMPWDASRIAVRELGGAASVVAAADGTAGGFAVGQPRFSPDGRHLAWVADGDGWLRVRVAEVDGRGAIAAAARLLVDEEHEHAEPTWGPGQRSWTWSPDGHEIAFCRNESGYGRLVAAAVSTRRLRRRPAPRELARAWHLGLDWTVPGEILAVRTGGVTVPQVVATAADGSGPPRAGAGRPRRLRGPRRLGRPGRTGAGHVAGCRRRGRPRPAVPGARRRARPRPRAGVGPRRADRARRPSSGRAASSTSWPAAGRSWRPTPGGPRAPGGRTAPPWTSAGASSTWPTSPRGSTASRLSAWATPIASP